MHRASGGGSARKRRRIIQDDDELPFSQCTQTQAQDLELVQTQMQQPITARRAV
jgi:hypothetical protein